MPRRPLLPIRNPPRRPLPMQPLRRLRHRLPALLHLPLFTKQCAPLTKDDAVARTEPAMNFNLNLGLLLSLALTGAHAGCVEEQA